MSSPPRRRVIRGARTDNMAYKEKPCGDNEIGDMEDLTLPKDSCSSQILHSSISTVGGSDVGEQAIGDSFIPGSQKIFLKTWGCTHNRSDSEYMAGLLVQEGYKITDEKDEAHLWILNSCTVKNPAEQHFKNELEVARTKGKYVVLSGCVPQASPNTPYLQGCSMLGVQQIDRVVEIVEETLKGNVVQIMGSKRTDGKKSGGAPLDLPKVRKNPLIEIIPINTGCLNHCTYCKTKQARGNLASYPISEIVERAEQAISEGVKEIWLTSEDTGAYGIDINETLPKLLYKVIDVIPEGCMLRLGMTNPPYIKDHLLDMSKILSHPRVYSFLHIPVQSGSDFVLNEMRREYFIEDFEEVVRFLKERIPGITIATDIICGFPTETEKDFESTVELVKAHEFPILFINQFYPRPGTPAATMKRIPTDVVKGRTSKLTALFHSYTSYDHKVGKEDTILVTEVSHDQKHLVGHNKFYEQVLIPRDEKYMGCEIDVVIESAGKYHMIGIPQDTTFYYKLKRNLFRLFMLFALLVCISIYNMK